MRRLKIALIASSYWEENRHHGVEEGGAIQQLAEAVAALGHEVIVLSSSPEVAKLRKAKIGALETWLWPRDKRRGFFIGLRDKLGRRTYFHRKVYSDAAAVREFLARRGPFDVIWAQSEAPDGLIVAIAAKSGRKLPPALVQIQNLRQRFEKGNPVFIERVPLGLAFRNAARILATSELIAKSLAHYAGPGLAVADLQAKVHVVYPNLQRAFLRTAESSSLAGPMPDRVLFLGELNQARGAMVFLSALPKTAASQRSASFIIMGDFTEANRRFAKRWEVAREAARLLLPGARMEFLGRVSTYEVIRQIKLARVVVIPALFNGFSRGLVEALILGRPVVATDKVGAWPLLQTHTCGLVIPAHDSASLAQAIDVVLSDVVPFADNARHLSHRLLHEFSPEAIALQVAHHLSEIAAPAK